MVGTIMTNLWIALLTFSISFLSAYPFVEGVSVVISAALWAILFFFITFGVRAIISYVLEDKTPKVEIEGPISQDEVQSPLLGSKEYAEIIKNVLNE